MKKNITIILCVLILSVTACALPFQAGEQEPIPPTKTPGAGVSTEMPTATKLPDPTPTPAPLPFTLPAGELRQQWAAAAETDLFYADTDFLLGGPGAADCADNDFTWYSAAQDPGESEYFLHLSYAYAVIPTEVNLVLASTAGTIARIELMDSSSGLGMEIFNDTIEPQNGCPYTFSIPVQTERQADTVIITFFGGQPPINLDAVELVGVLASYADLPVFWRIPIPADDLGDADSAFPGGMAVDENGNLFLANGHNGLLRFDVEGNLLQSYSVPTESNLRDVAVDGKDSLTVTDMTYQWFISLAYDGTQLLAGGSDFGWDAPREVAINPLDGSTFLLDETDERSLIRVYAGDTGEWLRDIPLEPHGYAVHCGLAFGPDGALYTLDKTQPAVTKIDPVSGEILDDLGYLELAGAAPSDLALDGKGNIYVLVNSSRDNSAVLVLSPQGDLIHRFGNLTYDGSNWQEGTFWFPFSLAVSVDGKFVYICENGYLTAFLLEEE